MDPSKVLDVSSLGLGPRMDMQAAPANPTRRAMLTRRAPIFMVSLLAQDSLSVVRCAGTPDLTRGCLEPRRWPHGRAGKAPDGHCLAEEQQGTSVIGAWSVFSADEMADVGIDNQTPVAEGIGLGPETRFTGKIHKITLEVK